MCGRFTLRRVPAEIRDLAQLDDDVVDPRYNVAPGQRIATILVDPEVTHPMLRGLEWGLLPFWVKEARAVKAARHMINARSETAATKPSFRAAFRHRRCLIPADGFYEWARRGGEKRPYYFQLKSEQPFAFAGLWEHWESERGEVIESCAILTTLPNVLVDPLHNRMPVMLNAVDYELWLDATVQTYKALEHCFAPFPADAMKCHEVDKFVNSPTHDAPHCIEAVPQLL